MRLNIKDTIYQSTPLGWAIYAGQIGIENYLRKHEAEAADEPGLIQQGAAGQS